MALETLQEALWMRIRETVNAKKTVGLVPSSISLARFESVWWTSVLNSVIVYFLASEREKSTLFIRLYQLHLARSNAARESCVWTCEFERECESEKCASKNQTATNYRPRWPAPGSLRESRERKPRRASSPRKMDNPAWWCSAST